MLNENVDFDQCELALTPEPIQLHNVIMQDNFLDLEAQIMAGVNNWNYGLFNAHIHCPAAPPSHLNLIQQMIEWGAHEQ